MILVAGELCGRVVIRILIQLRFPRMVCKWPLFATMSEKRRWEKEESLGSGALDLDVLEASPSGDAMLVIVLNKWIAKLVLI
jgi:hypothetical protein